MFFSVLKNAPYMLVRSALRLPCGFVKTDKIVVHEADPVV
jgi:hypothetical protein